MNSPLEPKSEVVCSQTPDSNQAFTLVELLTVVALVAVLASVRWSALSYTTNRSQLAVDFYNNKQLMAAANMYSADYNEILPGNGWGTVNDCWDHAANVPGGPATGSTFPTILSNQLEYCKRGQLFPYVRNTKAFLCPNDKTNDLYFQRVLFFTSYTWNGAVSGYGQLPQITSYKITRFKPDAILQWESDEGVPFHINDSSSFPDEGISGRHGMLGPIGLISGGTDRVSIRLWYSNNYAGASTVRGGSIPSALLPNRLWCNPGTPYGTLNR